MMVNAPPPVINIVQAQTGQPCEVDSCNQKGFAKGSTRCWWKNICCVNGGKGGCGKVMCDNCKAIIPDNQRYNRA